MQSLQSFVPAPASAAFTLGRAATDYVVSNPNVKAALPLVSEYGKKLQEGASFAAQNVNVAAALPLVSEYGKKLKEGASIAAQNVAQVAKDHPYAATAVGSGLAIAAAPALVAAPALAAVGFGSEGIVLASYAASIHSAIGTVSAGSTFATLTSAGMGGYGVAVVNGVVSGAGGAVAAMGGIAGAASWWNGGEQQKGEEDKKAEEGEEAK